MESLEAPSTAWTAACPVEDRVVGLRALLGIPEDDVPFAVIPVGWPVGKSKTADRSKPERIHRERW